ncbi:hypothetical protein EGW08_002448, partial [Elysia chlorotica]
DLQESAERTTVLDDERRTILSQLQDRQAQIELLQKTKSDVESGHVQTVSALTLQVQELEERRKKEEERRKEEEDRREGLAREVERLKKEAEERQKAVEEAERLREELAAKKLEAATALAVAKTQSALNASVKTRGADADDGRRLDVREIMDRKAMNQTERAGPGSESLLTSWAQKGPIQVYIAKYNYDPFALSPNENPEMELPLTAGDYVLVVGDMDEDGFFEGELIDGRQGLVPSNFIEIVEEEDLVEFHAALMQAGHSDYGNHGNLSNLSITSNNNSFSNPNNNNNNNNSSINEDAAAAVYHHPAQSRVAKGEISNGAMLEDPEDSSSDLEDIAELDEDNASVNSRILSNGGSTSSG